MANPDPTTQNTADGYSTVGIQAGQVHNSTVYMTTSGSSPREKYEKGVRYLEGGVPTRARELIEEAIAENYDNAEVRFHWFLAVLSKRSYRELSPADRERLRSAQEFVDSYGDSEWTLGLKVICDILDRMGEVDADPGPELKRLQELGKRQYAAIVKHLDFFLTGPVKDALWNDIRDTARSLRYANDRSDRVWAYFVPTPIGPRVRSPEPVYTTVGGRVVTVFFAAVFATMFGYLGWLVLRHGAWLPVLLYPLAVAGGYVGLRNVVDWRFRTVCMRRKERELRGIPSVPRASSDGFAKRVDDCFDYYFYKFVPKRTERATWLAGTAGVRKTLRDEIVELYREDRVGEDRVRWLIRHLVAETRKRWEKGTLWEHRERYRTAMSVKVWCCVGLSTAVVGTVTVVDTAVRADVGSAAVAALVALLTGWAATRRWLQAAVERRCYWDEQREYEQKSEERSQAYACWTAKLARLMPSEEEMEHWLNCDKTVLLDNALREYKLSWRDVIAYTFLQTPGKNSRRARVPGGPWRYSRYEIRLFLITVDGVREVSSELDLRKSAFSGQQRTNFRFDAVASVSVATTGRTPHTLKLTLVNGPAKDIRVVGDDPTLVEPEEQPQRLTEMTLEASGFGHALHVLEGIAAEGKEWIQRSTLTASR